MALGLQQDFEVHSGDDRTLEVTVNDAAGAVVNITGATATWALVKLDDSGTIPAPKSETPLFSKTVGSGITLVDAVNGRLDVAIDAVDTEALRGEYYHELEIVLAAKKSTIMFGKVTIYRDLVQ